MAGIWLGVAFSAIIYCIHEMRQRNHALDDDPPSGPQDNIDDYMSGYDKARKDLREANTMINVETQDIMNEYEGMDTAAFVQKLLEKLNCKYDSEDDGAQNNTYFVYQGEHFVLSCFRDNAWVRIIDVQWYHCELDNLEEISCMQKAINAANAKQVCSAVYGINYEDNEFGVYSKCDFPIYNQFPSPDQYLASWLSNFFRLKQAVVMQFEKEKQRIGIADKG